MIGSLERLRQTEREWPRAAAEDGTVIVSVRDHGPGIGPGEERLVFEKFGLNVISEPGATFTFRVPAS